VNLMQQNVMSPPPNKELPWLRVSHSSTNTFAFCPRKFEFQKLYGQGKERPDDDSIPAAVGRAFHRAYQEFVVSHDENRAYYELLRAYPWELALTVQQNRRTWDVVMSTFEEAIKQFHMWDYDIMRFKRPDGVEVPCVELPFELRFLNTEMPGFAGIAFIGYIDLVLLHKATKEILATDIKTHQSTIRDRTAEYMYNSQQIPYGVVVEHLLGNPVESFNVSYHDCHLSLPEPRVQVYEFTKTQGAIQEWLTAKILQFRSIKSMLELELFSRRESGCVAFNYPCKFLDICVSRDSRNIQAWFDQLENKVDDWNPWIVADVFLEKGLV